MRFIGIGLCLIFGSFFVGDAAKELKSERFGAFGLDFMTSVVIIAVMFSMIM